MAKEELKSLKYHPLWPNELMSSVKDECETNIKAKKRKRCSKGKSKSSVRATFNIKALFFQLLIHCVLLS